MKHLATSIKYKTEPTGVSTVSPGHKWGTRAQYRHPSGYIEFGCHKSFTRLSASFYSTQRKTGVQCSMFTV